MRPHEEHETTTCNSVYNKLHLRDRCCIHCQRRRRRTYYRMYRRYTRRYRPDLGYHVHDMDDYQSVGKRPNWKLVSKNRKQWMGKPTRKNWSKYIERNDDMYEIVW